jgi:hypothetical protein
MQAEGEVFSADGSNPESEAIRKSRRPNQKTGCSEGVTCFLFCRQ